MLISLRIRNVALIKDLTVEFTEGLNILSGETGAGKSILIDSLNFVLGGKADKSMIRGGEEACRVDAVLELGEDGLLAYAALAELGAEPEDTVVLSRSMDASGKSRCSVNGQGVTVGMLKAFTAPLSDISGQSEHHSLMRAASHIELVDRYGGEETAAACAACAKEHAAYRDTEKRLSAFGADDGDRERMLDLLRYQIAEIEEAEIAEGEEEALKAVRTKAMNVERIVGGLTAAAEALGRDGACLDFAGEALAGLSQAARFDSDAEELAVRLKSARLELQDIADTAASLAEGYAFNEADLERIERRLDTLRLLHKKYGASATDIAEFLRRAKSDYDRLSNAEEEIARLKAELAARGKRLYAACAALSAARRSAAARLEADVAGQLASLGLPRAQFAAVFHELPPAPDVSHAGAKGFDTMEFYFTANPGQPLKPLVKVISGGEASRFMLAIKTITADIDRVPLLVFDEIDTGISGEIAQMVAEKFAAISRRHQLLAITHLPQIAAMGDSNFLIRKSVTDGQTETRVVRLDGPGKTAEVARLAGGSNVGTHGVLHAEELIAWCEAKKKNLA